MKLKQITLDAVFTAFALIVFIIELQIPNIIPIPGVKLGLANVITVVAMFVMGPIDTAVILFCRVLLGSFFTGNIMSLIYSISGSILCYLTMLIMRKIITDKQIWVSSIIGAIMHNVGQIIAAMFVMQTTAIFAYFPILLISGIIAGTFTGLVAQYLVLKIKKLSLFKRK